jgi:hypothetical protein
LKKPTKKHRPVGLPSREDVVAFIGTHKGKAGVREIARAFGLKNADRASLRHMLRDLGNEGVVEQRRKKLHHAGTLPSVVLSDIAERDRDGELIAIPTEWDTEEHGAAPRIRVHERGAVRRVQYVGARRERARRHSSPALSQPDADGDVGWRLAERTRHALEDTGEIELDTPARQAEAERRARRETAG